MWQLKDFLRFTLLDLFRKRRLGRCGATSGASLILAFLILFKLALSDAHLPAARLKIQYNLLEFLEAELIRLSLYHFLGLSINFTFLQEAALAENCFELSHFVRLKIF